MPLPIKGKSPPPRKKPGPATVKPEQLICRSRGTLLGLAVGDALGATNISKRLPSEQFPRLNAGVHTEMRGSGPFGLKRGQVTDDTQLATCLATTLKNLRVYDILEAGKEYARWVPHAFEIDPHTKDALALVAEGKHPEFTGKRVWLASYQKAISNGSLSRCAPIGVFFRWDQAARINATL